MSLPARTSEPAADGAPPLVSVILPVRNGAATLRASVQSLLTQTLRALEIVVVDDGSTDETPAMLAELAADPRLRTFRQPASGIVAALNHGIRQVRGPLLARLDADDLAYPQRLARQAAAFAANPQLVLLGTAADVIDMHGAKVDQLRYASEHAPLVEMLPRRSPFIHSSVMLRAAAVRAAGGYRAALETAEDYDLWFRLSEIGQIGNLPETLVAYRRWPGSYSSRRALQQAFAAAIARRCAVLRRQTGADPLEADVPQLSWHDPALLRGPLHLEAAFYALLERLTDSESSLAAGELASLASLARSIGSWRGPPGTKALAYALRRGRLPSWRPKLAATRWLLALDPWRALQVFRKAG